MKASARHPSVEYKTGMKMKIPTGGSGNGYYGHDSGVISYLDTVETEADVQAAGDGDFSEYMWMENEEEFDKQVLQQLEEEELMEECLEAMLEEERQHQRNQNSAAWSTATSTVENNGIDLCQQLGGLRVHDDLAKQSTLNPDAAEFVPAYKPAITLVSGQSEVTTESS
ncbi:polyadenylate-binding protein-interacting protein 2 isoform X2 [Neodiprion pinetum]|uniref:Polyadenylate-binding protein-interacting protein 2 isoform X2 n=1 Tax=Neodiprion lecontei TaxID=441921 RepID=A0ABM3GHI0_NEOLC|nr:polyadenylate-binding protein-interacting protein 2 isoform X2 [Neodiprion fabricii]XP_046488766.1 polyadenylate-binding protein-interacting protein 2 isoform X2 [Neodiprion pinetum]XP_046599728.1 polyadenylate-binding protein-interacting protein 2 isoform X2 [Neodiprion lecontei]XP_046624992.1 polyadenylate-binding protein-interacting protein 2 isoform X2 [Neodiprion virginianus]